MAPPVLYRVIYGTTEPEPWRRSLTTVRPALLQDYRRHKVKHADYPAILPHGSSSVRGSLVTGLLDEDIRRLDIFEGSEYNRQKVDVLALKDTALNEAIDESKLSEYVVDKAQAETYVWTAGAKQLESEEWDFEEFKREKMYAWIGQAKNDSVEVDQGFADVDEDRETSKHDGTGGRAMNGHIGKELAQAQQGGTAKAMEGAAV